MGEKGVTFLDFFFANSWFIQFTGCKSAQKLIAKKKFDKNIEFFLPGGDFEIFLGVNDVTREVHMLHG